MKRIILACVLLWALPARAEDPAPAPAPDPIAEAKRLYQEGNTHYALGEYAAAADKFKEAFRLSKKPLLLYNVGQAYRLGNEPTKALTFYKSYLNAAPDAANRAEVERYIGELTALIASQEAASSKPPTSTVPPDGDKVKIPPPDRVPEPSPSPAAVPEEPRGGSRPIYKKWWFWAGVGAVAVGATVAVVMASGGGGNGEPDSTLGTTPIF